MSGQEGRPKVAVSADPFEKKGRHMQFSEKFWDESLLTLDGKFKLRFEEPHRRLKASIHRCQANAYSKQGLSLDESEQMSRQCFLPLLLVRRHAQTMVLNARD